MFTSAEQPRDTNGNTEHQSDKESQIVDVSDAARQGKERVVYVSQAMAKLGRMLAGLHHLLAGQAQGAGRDEPERDIGHKTISAKDADKLQGQSMRESSV